MNNQGFIGALIQYFTIEDKPRLHRRNTFFEDIGISDDLIFKIMLYGVVAFVLTIITYVILRGFL